MRFLGLALHQRIPDAKTIWLFRETVAQAGVVETLFKQFDTYLASQGLQARGGQLIDASLIPVPKQRKTREENATIKAGDCPADWEAQPAKRRQKDTEAQWTVKRGISHYDAAVHDSQVFTDMLQPQSVGRDVWADAAYRSEEIEAQLKKRKLRSRIQYKGYRAKPLTTQQTSSTRHRSRIRARVEHVFGHQIMAMGGNLVRTIGRVRARAKIGLKNLTYNFQRFLVLTTAVRGQMA